ncbi:MAG TPA: hypothetical protein VLE97_10890 [Gaiellaceae bacterium]|nr:hypothetical protein [Gaiellaceae bacterium]
MSTDWRSAGQRWLEHQAAKKAAGQKRAWIKRGRSDKLAWQDLSAGQRSNTDEVNTTGEAPSPCVSIGSGTRDDPQDYDEAFVTDPSRYVRFFK